MKDTYLNMFVGTSFKMQCVKKIVENKRSSLFYIENTLIWDIFELFVQVKRFTKKRDDALGNKAKNIGFGGLQVHRRREGILTRNYCFY